VLGKDHALSGAVAFAALAPLAVNVTGPELALGTVLTAGAALLPDLDEPGSTISRGAGFLTMGFAHVVRWAARGHRRGTHSLLGAAAFTGLAFLGVITAPGRILLLAFLALMISCALRASRAVRGHRPDIVGLAAAAGLYFGHVNLAFAPACVLLGVLSHILGDMATHGGCPLLWPVSDRDFHDTPLAFTTGKLFESAIVTPVLVISLAAALAWDTGLVGYLAVHTSGHLAR
jgi:membrane-bound metal-dependent hydrolase YbcI (DUF457 family)